MTEPTAIKIGAWTARPSLNLVERGAQSIKLEPRAMDVLMLLARRAGQVVSLEELLANVWKGVVVGDGSVYLAINQLRHALDDAGAEASHIETIPKRGYRLTAPVAAIDGAPVPAAAPHPRFEHRWAVAAVASVLLAGALTLVLYKSRPASEERTSIAVLPFANLSSDAEGEYFADGVTDEIANVLSRIRGLRVTGRASSFVFKGSREDLRAIGARLGVAHILEGSVRTAGTQIRVTTQLSEARTGDQLWSETYERDAADIFAIQDEIAESVAGALQVTLGVGDVGRLPGMTRNVDAYAEYLRGFGLYLDARPESAPLAIASLQRAVAIDPSFSNGWVKLHSAYVNAARIAPSRADEWLPQAAAALARAQELSPDAPEVLLETAIAETNRGRWAEAGAMFERVLSAYSEYDMDDQPRGVFLLNVGRVREAVVALEHARATEPLAVAFAYFLSDAYLARGDFDAALAEADRGGTLGGLEPSLRHIGVLTALATGDPAEIVERIATFSEAVPEDRISKALGAFIDVPDQARFAVRTLAVGAVPAEKAALAQWAGHYGDPDLALALLTEVAGELPIGSLLWRPQLRDARKLPEFKTLVGNLGLVAYWREYGWPDFCRPQPDRDFACE